MTLAGVTFRETIGPIDADRQYTLWRRATEGLPLAWSSSLANARALAARAARFPGSRLYAERNAELVGYIGTHPPFDWGEMGVTAPFGHPWTWPRDEALAGELYTRMLEAVPRVYAVEKPRMLLQRFRSTWSEQLAFMEARGWTERFRKGIWARRAGSEADGGAGRLIPLGADPHAFAKLSAYADTDATLVSRPSASTISEQAASGWFSPERCWEAEGLGAFSLDIRGDWSSSTRATGAPASSWPSWMSPPALTALTPCVLHPGDGETARITQLRNAGFALIDADIYVGLESERRV